MRTRKKEEEEEERRGRGRKKRTRKKEEDEEERRGRGRKKRTRRKEEDKEERRGQRRKKRTKKKEEDEAERRGRSRKKRMKQKEEQVRRGRGRKKRSKKRMKERMRTYRTGDHRRESEFHGCREQLDGSSQAPPLRQRSTGNWGALRTSDAGSWHSRTTGIPAIRAPRHRITQQNGGGPHKHTRPGEHALELRLPLPPSWRAQRGKGFLEARLSLVDSSIEKIR